jgi:hypothetical protein
MAHGAGPAVSKSELANGIPTSEMWLPACPAETDEDGDFGTFQTDDRSAYSDLIAAPV